MSELTTQQMIDTIRKGDKLGHGFLQGVADRLADAEESLTIAYMSGTRDAKTMIMTLKAENERLREAIKNVIAYEHCGECGEDCLVFFEEKPCHAYSNPCDEVFTLLKLVWPEFVEHECKEFGGK